MKGSFVRLGVLTCVATGLFAGGVAAESVDTTNTASYVVAQYSNPTVQQINELLTKAAIQADIPPEVVKAIAAQESGWKQFDSKGNPLVSDDGGIGIMQITNKAEYDQDKLKTDIAYNIEKGVEILKSMYDRTDLPKVKGADRHVIENWYFPVMAYNGTKPVNSPIKLDTGAINTSAYQEKVFATIESNDLLGGTQLGEFSFSRNDFHYNSTSDANIEFLQKEFAVSKKHNSAYFYKAGDKVVVTGDNVNLRPKPGTSETGTTKLSRKDSLTIMGDFEYDQNTNSSNKFVWYPVKTAAGKLGYITSAYIGEPTAGFTDVSAKYQDAVSYVVSKGVNGYSTTLFGTDKNIKRVDAAVMIAEVLDLDVDAAPASGFTDVPPRAVKQVNALKALGVTNGKTPTTLDSQSEITRGELAIWIQRAFQLKAGSSALPFTDVADRYTEAVSALVNNGVTNGTSASTFGTHNKAKRGDFAIFLYRAAN
jgi:hypothetical protein